MTLSPFRRRSRLGAAVVSIAALFGALTLPALSASPATAASSPDADAAAAWLATQVAPDGSVSYTGTPSVNWSVNVALALATTGTQPAALDSALGYIATHVEEYVTSGAADLPGRLGYLILLVDATGGDPGAFGTPATDLVQRLQDLYESTEPGFYGAPDPYTAVTDQSLAIMALLAAGETVPAAAVSWLTDQQCRGGATPASAVGGWEPYRAAVGGVLPDCVAPDAGTFTGPETNSTAFAVEALSAVGTTGPVPVALDFLRSAQTTSGAGVGGFAFYPGSFADPNSTAVIIQALVAAGEDPTGAPWTAGGATPLDSLASWIVPTGDADAGALASPYSGGFADLYATYQGVWGLTLTAFPFTMPLGVEPTTTTTTTAPTTPVTEAPGPSPSVVAVQASPAFTG